MTYRASLDNFCKAITVFVTLITLFPIGEIVYDMTQAPLRLEEVVKPLLIIVLIVGVLLLLHGFAPKSYTLTRDSLVINRPIMSAIYRLSEIVQVEALDKGALWSGIRLFGVGGVFGYYGLFWNSRHGRMTLYATRSDHKILITFTDGKKILITPDSMEMLEELRRRLAR